MEDLERSLREFVDYAAKLKGDEKGEAQVFCDRLFNAFGWDGYKEAGATLEDRVTFVGPAGKKSKKFVDLLWPGRLLIEMKSRGEKLEQHYQQAFEYWQHIVPHRPRYVILCNFDEIWIYDFDLQLYEPVERLAVTALPERHPSLSFMLRTPAEPVFGNNRVAVTREAADKLATLFNHLVKKRGIDREIAQRFILQCVVCLFAEDIGLLPKAFFTRLIHDCLNKGESTFDVFGELFRWMNSPESPTAGRFKGVRYFNGGIFAKNNPVHLEKEELVLLGLAAEENWSKVQPAIFGTLFQHSMDEAERHAIGAHFTSEADIQKVVLPTIVKPWREIVRSAKTREELVAARKALEAYRVLDPACGSGNFLYVAYRELVRIEMDVVKRLRDEFPLKVKDAPDQRPKGMKIARRRAPRHSQADTASLASFISVKQFHGIDINNFGVELAKITLVMGKKLAYDEVLEAMNIGQMGFALESPLPLENLDANIVRDDAVLCKWPAADAIIGNPPYQSKNKAQTELGAAYLRRIRKAIPEIPGRADYCVYWFRRTHDHLDEGGRAGLVGTNTIRQNYSREGGLDYIVNNGGTITEAVSTQVWSGDAAVHVSIVNWLKGDDSEPKVLSWQEGDKVDSPWDKAVLKVINSSLSPRLDLTTAMPLKTNSKSDACAQGQTHGNEGFLLTPDEAREMVEASPDNAEVLFPFMIGDDLLGRADRSPSRWVIDFHPRTLHQAAMYTAPFARVKHLVLPDRKAALEREQIRNKKVLDEDVEAKVNLHHKKFLDQWWLLSWPRGALIRKLATIPRYFACVCLTKRPIFEFISSAIHPNAALQVFAMPDDYSFGILQSSIHWKWFVERCSTMKRDFRYTSDTVFDTFPWPQKPSAEQVRAVAKAAVKLRATRNDVMKETGVTLRELYRQLEEPGKSSVKDAQDELDVAVRAAYGMKAFADPLAHLLGLNLALAADEEQRKEIVGPGLPPGFNVASFVTDDCVRAPKL